MWIGELNDYTVGSALQRLALKKSSNEIIIFFFLASFMSSAMDTSALTAAIFD